jgi:hypothetical protein
MIGANYRLGRIRGNLNGRRGWNRWQAAAAGAATGTVACTESFGQPKAEIARLHLNFRKASVVDQFGQLAKQFAVKIG